MILCMKTPNHPEGVPVWLATLLEAVLMRAIHHDEVSCHSALMLGAREFMMHASAKLPDQRSFVFNSMRKKKWSSHPSVYGCTSHPHIMSVSSDAPRIEELGEQWDTPKELVTEEDLRPIDDTEPIPLELPENAVLREDRHRELRSMLLSVHPCPPLPQLALGGLYKEERVFSSHDFLATAIDRMLVKKDNVFDALRRDKQHKLVTDFFTEMRALCAPEKTVPSQAEESGAKADKAVPAFPSSSSSQVEESGAKADKAVPAFPPSPSSQAEEITIIAGVLPSLVRLSEMKSEVVSIDIPDSEPLSTDGSEDVDPVDTKPIDTDTADIKVIDANTSEINAIDAGTSEIKAIDANTSEIKAIDANTSEIKAIDANTSEIKAIDVLETDPTPTRLKPFDKLSNVVQTSSTALSERIYKCFTTFSRQHAIVYFLENDAHNIDIRYKDLDHVCKGDPIHLAACSHLRAFRIVRGVEPTSSTQYHDDSYADVIVAFAREVVHDGEDDTTTTTEAV
jgi:hypothetical protein